MLTMVNEIVEKVLAELKAINEKLDTMFRREVEHHDGCALCKKYEEKLDDASV